MESFEEKAAEKERVRQECIRQRDQEFDMHNYTRRYLQGGQVEYVHNVPEYEGQRWRNEDRGHGEARARQQSQRERSRIKAKEDTERRRKTAKLRLERQRRVEEFCGEQRERLMAEQSASLDRRPEQLQQRVESSGHTESFGDTQAANECSSTLNANSKARGLPENVWIEPTDMKYRRSPTSVIAEDQLRSFASPRHSQLGLQQPSSLATEWGNGAISHDSGVPIADVQNHAFSPAAPWAEQSPWQFQRVRFPEDQQDAPPGLAMSFADADDQVVGGAPPGSFGSVAPVIWQMTTHHLPSHLSEEQRQEVFDWAMVAIAEI